MELKALEKTQSGAGVGGGDGPSGVPIAVSTLPRTSGGQDFESGDPHHHSNSLDKRTYVSSYIGNEKDNFMCSGCRAGCSCFLTMHDFRMNLNLNQTNRT